MFIKNKNICTFYIDAGRSTCCYFVGFRYDYGNTRFPSGAFSINSFNDFNGTVMCIGGPQQLKTVETVLRNETFFSLASSIVGNLQEFNKLKYEMSKFI